MNMAEQIAKAREAVAEEIEAFLVDKDMSPTTFGLLSMSDKSFVFRLRQGRKLEPDTIDAIRLFMKAYRAPLRRRPNVSAAA